MSPKRLRGRFSSSYQLAITVGIVPRLPRRRRAQFEQAMQTLSTGLLGASILVARVPDVKRPLQLVAITLRGQFRLVAGSRSPIGMRCCCANADRPGVALP